MRCVKNDTEDESHETTQYDVIYTFGGQKHNFVNTSDKGMVIQVVLLRGQNNLK